MWNIFRTPPKNGAFQPAIWGILMPALTITKFLFSMDMGSSLITIEFFQSHNIGGATFAFAERYNFSFIVTEH
jgi:hypothetical protein